MTTTETTPEAAAPVADGAPASGRQLRRRVFALAAPVIGENLLQTLLGVVDTILVAGLGAATLAGVGVALQVTYVLIAALSALAVGASVLVAQAVGAGRTAEASHHARQALLWSVLVAVPLTVGGLALTPAIIGLFGLAPDVAAIAESYLGVKLGATVTLTVMFLASAVLRGAGNARTPMLVTALANVLNLGLSWALIYGHAGLPALGANGSAWGTVFSRGLGAAILVVILLKGHNGVRVAGGSWAPSWAAMLAVLAIGMPAALEEMLVIGAFAALTPVVATLGTVDLAAHRVVINILSLSFLPGLGFGLAATALVGQAVGAGRMDEARASTAIALRWAAIWMGGFGLLCVVFAGPLMRLFSDDPVLVSHGATATLAVALCQPLWAATFVYAGALRGTGDTRTPLLITGGLMWAAVAIAFVTVRFAPALWAVWAAFLFTGPLETLLFWQAWRRARPRRTRATSSV